MKITYAPMEGITNVYYRRLHRELFGGIDHYYTPFISVFSDHNIKKRDQREVDPENNKGQDLIPQLLTNSAPDLVWAFHYLRDMGYEEINLNLGCPSGTVTAKKKGSGFLRDTAALKNFFDEVFDCLGDEGELLSVKTRIGINSPDEMEAISEVYKLYPIRELIIHPRVQKQFYKGLPDMTAFRKAYEISPSKVAYNGNIFNTDDYAKVVEAFGQGEDSKLSSVMLGRGIVADPSLARQIKGGEIINKDEFRFFLTELEAIYRQELRTDKNVFFKMKELWSYMSGCFEGSDKYLKSMLKAKDWTSFKAGERALMDCCRIRALEGGLEDVNIKKIADEWG
ncbi:tRNA-dihydrouridine synthase family protein [Butyrivibrio sp. MC2013]|uniref:tRNA-dihydrouridine synthase family protein n=1 Tax=Butyrivibrio sp. MC2013 TaxID=1280686 RepID=UPI00068699B8|nr:tRNA-dihydrouridine synthase family protein [Butyrivibrio sp. MC2013]